MSTITQENLDTAVATILSAVSSGGSDTQFEQTLLKALSKEHRTIQQSAIRSLVQVLTEYGDDESYDARNEASKLFCQGIDRPYFPYI